MYDGRLLQSRLFLFLFASKFGQRAWWSFARYYAVASIWTHLHRKVNGIWSLYCSNAISMYYVRVIPTDIHLSAASVEIDAFWVFPCPQWCCHAAPEMERTSEARRTFFALIALLCPFDLPFLLQPNKRGICFHEYFHIKWYNGVLTNIFLLDNQYLLHYQHFWLVRSQQNARTETYFSLQFICY